MAAFQPVHGCSFRLSRRLLASRFQDVPDQECHMTITSQPSTDGQELTISISGRFDFNAHQTFRRSEEHTSELQSLMRISYAVFCLKKKNKINTKSLECTTYETVIKHV